MNACSADPSLCVNVPFVGNFYSLLSTCWLGGDGEGINSSFVPLMFQPCVHSLLRGDLLCFVDQRLTVEQKQYLIHDLPLKRRFGLAAKLDDTNEKQQANFSLLSYFPLLLNWFKNQCLVAIRTLCLFLPFDSCVLCVPAVVWCGTARSPASPCPTRTWRRARHCSPWTTSP